MNPKAQAAISKLHNFSAGPGILPQSVLEEASAAALSYGERGLSILEISHRSKDFVDVMEEARSLVRELMGLSDAYEVLFLQGGASSQFYMVPYNLLPENGTAHYLDTGTWAHKSIKEAKIFGNVNVLASSKEANYTYIPKDYELPTEGAYLHCTSNNTVYGNQMKSFPKVDMPIVCDMSSDIFSKPIDIEALGMGLVYAGAQKNMGPAGATLVIVRKDILGKVEREIPSMVDYRTHIKKDSMFNTPPVFPIYVSMLTLRWLKERGGPAAMEKHNQAKADLLYGEIERNPLFRALVNEEDRSLMNVTFNVNDGVDADAFLKFATDSRLDALKGHRSVGGFRASIYNAMELESVQALVDAMQEFERTHG